METNELKERLAELIENVREAESEYQTNVDELATAMKWRDKAFMLLVKEEIALQAFKKENAVDLFTKLGTI